MKKEICILPGDVADPSILKEGDYFYLVCSTFCYFPGLLLYKSRDLLHWERVCYTVTQNFGDIWAPDLVKHGDRFYIYFPSFGRNWVVWSAHLEYGWSDPIDLGPAESLIDPGHISDGKNRYLYFNNGYMARLTPDGLKLAEAPHVVQQPWKFPEEWLVQGVCNEGPKLFYRNGYYYLITAQGGTAGPATSHMAVCFRSASPEGGWEASPYNPIIHTYAKEETWWSKGHATYFEDQEGKGYFIFHGYKQHNRNMGRQVLLCRAEWTEDGWPIAQAIDLPDCENVNYDFHDAFDAATLGLDWSFYQNYDKSRYALEHALILKAHGADLAHSCPMVINNRYEDYLVTVCVTAQRGAKAGITLFYNEQCNIGIYLYNGAVFTSLNASGSKKLWDVPSNTVYLCIMKKDNCATFFMSTDGITYKKSIRSYDITAFEHNVYGGFLACRPGVFVANEASAKFHFFDYRGL